MTHVETESTTGAAYQPRNVHFILERLKGMLVLN